MKDLRLLESVLAVAVWFTDWGIYLIFCSILLFYPDLLGQLALLEDHPNQIVYLIFACIVLRFGLKRWHQQLVEHNHRKASQDWAASQSWSYTPGEDRKLYEHYGFLYGIPGYAMRSLSSGKRFPCALNVLEGKWQEYTAKGFTYYSRRVRRLRRRNRMRTKVSHYYLAIALIQVNHHFPKLYVRPVSWLDPLVAFMGLSGDNKQQTLTVRKSNIRYQIFSFNQQFTQQFLNAAGVEEMLGAKPIRFEVDRNVLAIYQEGRLQPETLQSKLEQLHQIYQLIPEQWKR